MTDILIKNGMIIDGTGREAFVADIAIQNGLISAIGSALGKADEIIDAKGQIVTPGFVDLHTHYDGQVSWDEKLEPSVYHGVTTVVMGNCGVGFAPVHPEDHEKLISLMEGVEEIPGAALAEGLTWEWSSFPEYLDAIDTPHTIDFAAHLCHDPLRVYVMRDRALFDQEATEEDISAMRLLTEEALAAGAIGFSTGRSDVHRSSEGEWTPSSEATEEELAGIGAALSSSTHGVLQAVNDFDLERDDQTAFEREWALLEKFAQSSEGRPFSLSLMQRDFAPQQWQHILEKAEKAKAKDIDIRLQVAPRGIGVTLGLNCTFHPFMGHPSYKKIHDKPLRDRVTLMKDPAFKVQLLSETMEPLAGDGTPIPPLADKLLQMIDFISCKMFLLDEYPDYEQGPENSVYKMAERAGVPPLEMIYDLMLQDEGQAFIYFPIYNYTNMNYDALEEMMAHPQSLMGLSDGGAHVGTVCDASFPTYLLSHWTRDRTRGKKISLEEAVKRLTSESADYIGFQDRGRLEVGKKADINIIDYDKLRIKRPTMVTDLPAGGKRLMQKAEGMTATLVAGKVILKDGCLTGELPGRLVRGGQLKGKLAAE
ncbi:amidohydrolase family protein [Temperatibacter marinus]|uniref:Amidohydrolase family protein n=1 Tax=Temperatibacter marinus TaxID=1456591 RepID=A0AA52H898_9PROT|nr:amidohydrolase family protein [Temperatibacter marinus]WND01614.1 amidohydrolase family protein [Temperatibacter marinus]